MLGAVCDLLKFAVILTLLEFCQNAFLVTQAGKHLCVCLLALYYVVYTEECSGEGKRTEAVFLTGCSGPELQ